ncbi:MAG: ABC transporter substrate-binding protein [Candidatus Competibacteraceae bacterium]|nr:ABC transporter substrate-binding protein [Candidatus Competibacteraceae bacterium]
MRPYVLLISGLIAASSVPALAAGTGVTNTTVKIGGVMDLKGQSKGLGLGMQAGISAALKGEKVQNRAIEYIALNDFYTPADTIKATKQLIDQGIFLMLGSVGTPTAKVALPILAENKVPAVGFFTGAGLLRPGVGDIINFRASYVEEITNTIEAALSAGVKPQEVCAYVQNDAYGMAGVSGIKKALEKQPDMTEVVSKLEQILTMKGEEPTRNGIGPVGVYPRNANRAREGYLSLKQWEQAAGTRCRLVVTVGTYNPIASFIGYSRYKGDNWIVSAVSFTGADNLTQALLSYKVTDKVILTNVVPALDSQLPIVEEARKALGDQLSYVSLEGFIVGKLFLAIARNIKGDITRDNFLKAVRGQTFDLDGLKLDFTNDNQGSDFVQLTYLDNGELKSTTPQKLAMVFQQ